MREISFVRDDIAVLLKGFALKNLLTIVVRDSSHAFGMTLGQNRRFLTLDHRSRFGTTNGPLPSVRNKKKASRIKPARPP